MPKEYIFDHKLSTELCEIMGRNRSDKGHKNILNYHHNYTTFYHSIFNKRKNDKLSIFELGLGTNNVKIPSNMGINGRPGASLYGWKEYFPNSEIYGGDIDKNILFEEDRIKTYYCDQTSVESINKLWTSDLVDKKFDIIIEDGLHTYEANVCFFENSIHKLNDGGIYIIEDIICKDKQKFLTKIKTWELSYPYLSFTLLDIPNNVNKCDNILLVVENDMNITKNPALQYYNRNIKIEKKVINDIFANILPTTKMLVFGLGYDSKMWYEGTNKNTYFVENNHKYIELNKENIASDHIIKYDYKTTCEKSIKMTDEEIKEYEIPNELLKLGPFDIIIIDGPEGWNKNTPGRLLPCYWSTLLSKPSTLIYIDDSIRELESYCIKKYFDKKIEKFFTERSECTKIHMDKSPNKIAIYSANFGNYRNEIANINNIEFDKNIDYYFFTDNKNLRSNIWNIILVPLQPQLNFIDSNRHTAKHTKFIVPEILKQYDTIIWIDSRVIKYKVNSNKLSFSSEKINNIITKSKNNNSIFIMPHYSRKTIEEEINITITLNLENKINGELFKNKINNLKINTCLLDSCCIMYNNTNENINIFKNIYDELISNGLKRDQNIIPYVFYIKNYESNIIYFLFNEIINTINYHLYK